MRARPVFGQYVAVDSPVHRLDARAKMGVAAVFAIALFAVNRFAGLLVLALFVALSVAVSRVPWSVAVRGVRAVAVILTFTLVAHAVRWQPATVSLLRLGPLALDAEGLRAGVFFAVRIVVLVIGTSLVTLTTTPVELSDGLERALGPLKVLGLPVGDLAMMLTIALRFIPTTAQEAEHVILAQTARGARLGEGGPLRRARAYVPVLVPLFVGLFRRADALAVAMEARCYRSGAARTRLVEPLMRAIDWAILALGALACIAIAMVC